MTDEKNEGSKGIAPAEDEKTAVDLDDYSYVRDEDGGRDEKGFQLDGTEVPLDKEPVDKDGDERVARGFVPLVPSRKPVDKDERIRELERKQRSARMYVLIAAIVLLSIGLSFLPSILLVLSPNVLMPIFLACASGGAALLVAWYAMTD